MIFYNGFVVYPDAFREVKYNISPFTNADVPFLKELYLIENKEVKIKTTAKFGKHVFSQDGKDAIRKVLSLYNLSSGDEVWIVTTSGNKYVSSCVTNEIEKSCLWKREWTPNTKIIFVVHEFGSIYKNMQSLKQYNLPIIEDMAMSMFSSDSNRMAGKYGDFCIYSLPKFFPIQFGGLIQCNNVEFYKDIEALNNESNSFFLSNYTEAQLCKEENICEKRATNYQYLKANFEKLNCKVALPLTKHEVPSVFMFYDKTIDLPQLKSFLQRHGIECSVFYGWDAFFIPVHQNLKKEDLDYMIELFKYFKYEL